MCRKFFWKYLSVFYLINYDNASFKFGQPEVKVFSWLFWYSRIVTRILLSKITFRESFLFEQILSKCSV